MPSLFETQCHEVGHALAVLLSGGRVTGISVTASVDPDDLPGEHSGETCHTGTPDDQVGFVAYSGLLFQALAAAAWVAPEYRVSTFRRNMILALRSQTKDFANVAAGDPLVNVAAWNRQLMPYWPIVAANAKHVKAGGPAVHALLRAAVKAV